jgi:hypothetical protein
LRHGAVFDANDHALAVRLAAAVGVAGIDLSSAVGGYVQAALGAHGMARGAFGGHNGSDICKCSASGRGCILAATALNTGVGGAGDSIVTGLCLTGSYTSTRGVAYIIEGAFFAILTCGVFNSIISAAASIAANTDLTVAVLSAAVLGCTRRTGTRTVASVVFCTRVVVTTFAIGEFVWIFTFSVDGVAVVVCAIVIITAGIVGACSATTIGTFVI